MSIYYPTLDEFWPAVRARNFVKALGGNPTKYVENMAFLAARAGVHVKQMWLVNPITFAERNCIPSVRKLLGHRTYVTLELVRNSKWHHSNSWAYEKGEPIPPFFETVRRINDSWDIVEATITKFLEEVKGETDEEARGKSMVKLFIYTMGTGQFIRANLLFYKNLLTEVSKMKSADVNIAAIIRQTQQFLVQVEMFLADEALLQKNLALKRLEVYTRVAAAAKAGNWGPLAVAESEALVEIAMKEAA